MADFSIFTTPVPATGSTPATPAARPVGQLPPPMLSGSVGFWDGLRLRSNISGKAAELLENAMTAELTSECDLRLSRVRTATALAKAGVATEAAPLLGAISARLIISAAAAQTGAVDATFAGLTGAAASKSAHDRELQAMVDTGLISAGEREQLATYLAKATGQALSAMTSLNAATHAALKDLAESAMGQLDHVRTELSAKPTR